MCYNKQKGDDAMRSYSSREVIKEALINSAPPS